MGNNRGAEQLLPNNELVEDQATADVNNGVVLLPERVVFTRDNAANYNF